MPLTLENELSVLSILDLVGICIANKLLSGEEFVVVMGSIEIQLACIEECRSQGTHAVLEGVCCSAVSTMDLKDQDILNLPFNLS
jgi:hypothetical protein